MAGPPPRRAGAAAPRPGRAVRRLRDAARGARRDRGARAAPRRAPTSTTVRARTVEAIAERGVGDGVVCEMVLRHELQHTETMRQTMAIAGLLPRRRAAALERRCTPARRPASGSRSPPAPFAMGAAGGGLRLRQRAPAPHASRLPAFRDRAPPGEQRAAGCASARAAATSGASGGRDEGWAWKEEYDITHHPAVAAGAPAGARLPRLLVRGRRLRPRARRAPAAPRPSGRGRRPGAGAAATARRARCGSGPAAASTATRASSPTPTASTRRCSSATTTACCAAARGRPRRASPPRRFRNWDLPQRRQIFAGVRLARDGLTRELPRTRAQTR